MMLVKGFFTNPMFATTPLEVEQQIDRIPTSSAKTKYSQAVEDEGRDVCDTRLSAQVLCAEENVPHCIVPFS